MVGPIADDMQAAFAAFLEATTPWVRYLGAVPQEQVLNHLRQGDMIVLPSRFETLPRILMEALAADGGDRLGDMAARLERLKRILEDDAPPAP